jgi:hypothetical protein
VKRQPSLPDDGIVLPKHVGAIVKDKAVYNAVHLLVNLYIFDNARYKNQNSYFITFVGNLLFTAMTEKISRSFFSNILTVLLT